VAAVVNMSPSLMRLLGTATYLAKFVPNFSEVTAKLRELFGKDAEFRWDNIVHGNALRELKQMLATAPVLHFYDVKMPLTVQCDASSKGIGAGNLQNGKPIEYASRAITLTASKTSAQIEKELLAVVFAMERFHTYVYGRDVTIETDHKPLVSAVRKALVSAPKRLQRMLLRLQRYNYTVVYRPGSQVLIADLLSRAYLPGNKPTRFNAEIASLSDIQSLRMVASEATIDLLKRDAANDEQYRLLLRQIATGRPTAPADVPASRPLPTMGESRRGHIYVAATSLLDFCPLFERFL
jgi:hypothetical protein